MPYDIDVELQAGAVLLATADLRDIANFRSTWAAISVETARARHELVSVSDGLIPAALPVPARVYRPDRPHGARLPAILLLHSGAYVAGSLETIHAEALHLCDAVQAVVVAPDYRLAPEDPYPAALDDCVATLEWMICHSDDLGIDPERVAVHGTSAGGGLAVATVLRRRSEHGSDIAFVHLNAPELDDRLHTESMRRFVDTPQMDRDAAAISWDCYLGELQRGSDDVPVFAAPGRADDLTGFPPTYVAVMQFDPLRDEGMAFAGRLLDAGVPVELHLFPQTFHGSSVIEHAEVSRREAAEQVAVLRRRLRSEGW